jgi:hypothetical protein
MIRWLGRRGGGLRLGIVLFACSSLCTVHIKAAENPETLLKSAWDEYGFQAFGNAQKLFAEVEDRDDATLQQRLQARLGQAFIIQYQMPGRNPEAAIPLYESLLKDTPDTSEWKVMLLTRLGDCHAELNPLQQQQARKLYRQALAAATDTSLIVQETILRLISTYMNNPDPEVFSRGLDVAQEFAPWLEGGHFESIFYGLQAELAFFLGDPELRAAVLERQYRAGINNVKIKENVLFQLARIHEVELRDFARAQAYYYQLAAEIPSSQKAYFARLRADELKEGKIQSAYGPPLPPLVEDLRKKEGADGR